MRTKQIQWLDRFQSGAELHFSWNGPVPSIARISARIVTSVLGEVVTRSEKMGVPLSSIFQDLSDDQCVDIFAEYVYELEALLLDVHTQAIESPGKPDPQTKEEFVQSVLGIYEKMCFLFPRVRACCQKTGKIFHLEGELVDLDTAAYLRECRFPS